MPRVITVENNRKEYTCRKCGKTIPKGAGYKHWSFRYGGKVIRCLNCPHPRSSELTQSSVKSQLYSAQESVEDALGEADRSDWETFKQAAYDALDGAKSTAEEARDECQEALDAWEHGNEMLQERVDAVEAWVDTIDSAMQEVDGFEPDEIECPDCNGEGEKELDLGPHDMADEPEKVECPTCERNGTVPDVETACNDIEEIANNAMTELEM